MLVDQLSDSDEAGVDDTVLAEVDGPLDMTSGLVRTDDDQGPRSTLDLVPLV